MNANQFLINFLIKFAVGYTMDHIVYRWLPEPVEFEKTIQLPQFSMVNFSLSDCSQNYTTGECNNIGFNYCE